MNRRLKPATRRLLFRVLPVFALLISGAAGVSRAETLDEAARQLARKIAAALAPHEAVALSLRNLSSLTVSDVAAIRRALEAELPSRGARLAQSAPHREVRVTLSENPRGYLWVAEIPRPEGNRVEMISLPKPVASATRPRLPEVVLEKKLLWEQEEPILDLAFLRAKAGPILVVLEPVRIATYRREGDRWLIDQSYPLSRTNRGLRDKHGRLSVSREQISAALPGDACVVLLRATSVVECRRDDRNAPRAGDGPRTPAGEEISSGNYYSRATLQDNGRVLKLFAGVDGVTRLFEDGPEPVATFRGWGSEMDSLHTGCAGGWQVLTTRAGDWTEPDAIQLYEIHERQAVPVSPPVDLPGPVTALNSVAEQEALAIVRNLKTGLYEAYQLFVSCGR